MDYNKLQSDVTVQKVIAALPARGITPHLVSTKEEALEKVRSLLPEGAELTTGGSQTLEQIGFTELLKSGAHPWKNLKDAIIAEKDEAKQAKLRLESTLAPYFLASVHAVTETGEILIASGTGSQLPSDAFSSQNLIWVVGTQKIVPTLEDAFKRLREYVFPLEDDRQKTSGNGKGSLIGKILIIEKEAMGRNIHLIFVKEPLGF